MNPIAYYVQWGILKDTWPTQISTNTHSVWWEFGDKKEEGLIQASIYRVGGTVGGACTTIPFGLLVTSNWHEGKQTYSF